MKPRAGDIALVRGSDLFDQAWYLAQYPDVGMLGMDPVEHYLRWGALLHRDPGPRFDTLYYLQAHRDVAASGMNPLVHYLRHGRREKRRSLAHHRREIPPEQRLRAIARRTLKGKPKRILEDFDLAAQRRFLEQVHLAEKSMLLDQPKVSIVMPTYNRGRTIGRAIESVLRQTYRDWELIVVDDGSTDDTVAIVEKYAAAEPRIRLYREPRAGVAAARNLGLANIRGELVAYLDSDNRWNHQYLQVMVAYLAVTGAECGYSALAMEDDTGAVNSYRGEPFDRKACLQNNYVDLNVFCHSRRLYEALGGFDESLRRMVDWDLILRYSKSRRVVYAPFLGCRYSNAAGDASRISVSQPLAYRNVVRTKNKLATGDRAEIARHLRLKVAIKIAAPHAQRKEWGDFHFAESLKASLEALGHVVDIDCREHWHDRPANRDHVVIVLRGLAGYKPSPGHITVMWNISHPDQVPYREYDAHDMVYVASPSYPALLGHATSAPVRTLLQCTDPSRFGLREPAGGERSGVLFVGNSRNRYRSMVRWAREAGLDVAVHGTRWAQFIGDENVSSEHIDNRDLADHYAGSAVVLNDHWESMGDFGFVSNRVFDVLCSGGSLVSDPVPALGVLFGDSVPQVEGPVELAAAVERIEQDPRPAGERARLSRCVAEQHSFDVRAKAICNDVLVHLGLPPVHVMEDRAAEGSDERPLLGILTQHSHLGPTSTGFIRAIAPLGTDAAQAQLRTCLLDGVDDPRLDDCDACLVQRVAVPGLDQAARLLERLAPRRIPLVVDTDDAFSLLPESHPELQAYRIKDAALRHLMRHADEVWFSTAALQRVYAQDAPAGEVVRNNLDPRIWRNYRAAAATPLAGTVARMLYMGSKTHDADFAMILPALDRLHAEHPGSFDVTLVGAVRQPPDRPWLKVLKAPGDCLLYPRFVRWLTRCGTFDVGLAPLEDNTFNACKSDIKFLDYCALGLVPVVSNVPAYSDDPRTRELAIRVDNTTDGWHRALEDVVLRKLDYAALAARASSYVWKQRTTIGADAYARVLALVGGNR